MTTVRAIGGAIWGGKGKDECKGKDEGKDKGNDDGKGKDEGKGNDDGKGNSRKIKGPRCMFCLF